jgi:hypothetical protein
MKGAAVGRNGLVPNTESYARIGHEFKQQTLSLAVQHWLDAERAVMAEA